MACIQDPEAPSNLPDAPVLSVDETSVTRVSMVANVTLTSTADVTEYGVEVSETLFEAGGSYNVLSLQRGEGSSYLAGVSNLKSNTPYFLRAFIGNGHSRRYSATITQKTPETSVASISDVTIRDNAYLVATIEDNGGREIEDVGFMWGTSNERKEIKREKRYPGTLSEDGKTFTLPLIEVGEGTYYIMAYAEDDKDGTGYSRIPYEYKFVKPAIPEPQPQEQPNNEIWYTSEDGTVVQPYILQAFNAGIVSNTYSDGKGVIVFDADVTEIRDQAFYARTQITSLQLPNSLLSIGQYAFDVTSIETIHIPDNVVSIASGCFSNCWKLASFTGKYASADGMSLIVDGTMVGFAPASRPEEFTVDSSVRILGESVFSDCTFLKKIHFPEELEEIGIVAFHQCWGLTTLEFPSSIKLIRQGAFARCENLTTLIFPQTSFTVERDAFSQCPRLSSLSGNYVTRDGRCMIIGDELVCLALAGLEGYSIPEGVTVTCTVNGMDDNGYPDLKWLEYPESVSIMGQIWYCQKLESITVNSVTPPAFAYVVWNGDDSPSELYNTNDCPILVPAESVEAYKTAKGWSSYADRIQAIDEGTPSGGNEGTSEEEWN